MKTKTEKASTTETAPASTAPAPEAPASPAPAPTAAEAQSKAEKPAKKAKKAAAKKQPKPADAKAGRDAFGGRIGTRMSKINVVVINAGEKGATIPEVAKATGESASIVSAQLGWIALTKKLATRKEEKAEDGKTVFRYFAKAAKE